jgi:hypothetical protein
MRHAGLAGQAQGEVAVNGAAEAVAKPGDGDSDVQRHGATPRRGDDGEGHPAVAGLPEPVGAQALADEAQAVKA